MTQLWAFALVCLMVATTNKRCPGSTYLVPSLLAAHRFDSGIQLPQRLYEAGDTILTVGWNQGAILARNRAPKLSLFKSWFRVQDIAVNCVYSSGIAFLKFTLIERLGRIG